MQIACETCCMNDSAKEIVLTKAGCNFCDQARKSLQEIEIEKPNLYIVIDKIKNAGKRKKYDVLVGLSGGVDSSTALHYVVQLGLRPLCFSVDNGYNRGKEADENILKLVEKLNVPFYRYTIDLQKFKELQEAFIKGGIKNLEALTDHLLFASTYEMAAMYGIRYIISGGNTNSESVMPGSWGEDPRDLYWIKSVYKKVTGKKLTGLPTIPLWKEQYYRLIKGIRTIRLLDYLEYDREKSIAMLKETYGYVPYGEKHCESLFTAWYQNYYLRELYGIDKRRAHYSSLICAGQMTRGEALRRLETPPPYPKLGWEEQVRRYPRKSYQDYPNSARVRKAVILLYKYTKKFLCSL